MENYDDASNYDEDFEEEELDDEELDDGEGDGEGDLMEFDGKSHRPASL